MRYHPPGNSKNSEVPWTGKIPGHWKIDRLKWSAESPLNGIWGSEPDGIDDIVCIRVADFDRVSLRTRSEKLTIRAVPETDRARRLLQAHDLLIEKSGGGDKQLVGAVVEFEATFPAVYSNFIARIAARTGMHPRYWVYVHAHLYAGRVNYSSVKQTTGIQKVGY